MSNLAFLALAAMATIVGGAVIFATYRRDLSEATRRVSLGRRIAATKLGPIEYGVVGSGAPALVIHGAGGGYDQGLLLAENFPRFRVIAPSRFGYLGTALPEDASPAAQADAHAALLDSLRVTDAVVIGVSAGAPSAIELTLRHPGKVKALILIVPRAYLPGRKVELPVSVSNGLVLRAILSGADFAYWAVLRMAYQYVVRFMGVPPEVEANASASEQSRVATLLESVLPLSLRIAGIKSDGETVLQPVPLEQIQAPTLIVTTKDDLFGTRDAAVFMEGQIPDARLVVFENGGHLLVGRQAELTEMIADFVAKLGGQRELSERHCELDLINGRNVKCC
jgi:2-hydroxy-6-oxonona-2,4-dienedioate hydrolase